MTSKRVLLAFAGIAFLSSFGMFAQQVPVTQQNKSLWIAKFTGETKAAEAVASVQMSDLNALQYSNLFQSVTSFTAAPEQPPGTWALTGSEVNFSGGSTAKRALIGYGSGRAHLVMKYELKNPDGVVAWTQSIKTEPSFWGSSGGFGAVQNQNAASGAQPQKLIDAISKFFAKNDTGKKS